MADPRQVERLETAQLGRTDPAKGSVYRPLEDPNHIRLLIILPSKLDEELHCVLIHADLRERPSYEALSYVWGDPKQPRMPVKLAYSERDIEDVPGIRHSFTDVPISLSLESALRNFRLNNDARVLWADALCIDQGNEGEKEREVLKMGQIYSLARAVLVWLYIPSDMYAPPPANENPEEAIAAAFTWCAHIVSEYDLQALVRLPRNLIQEERNCWPSALAIHGLIYLYSHPWFRRVWIIQEIALATGPIHVFCGWRNIRLQAILNSAYVILRLFEDQVVVRNIPMRAVALHHVLSFFRELNASNTPLPERVIEALCSISDFQTTVERDRLYGLLSLIGDIEKAPALTPNYKQSDDRFFEELARYLISSTGTAVVLDAWSQVDYVRHRSWIPSWKHTAPPPYLPLTRARRITKLRFLACGTCLHTNASKFGTVSYVKRIGSVNKETSPTEYLREMEEELEARAAPPNEGLLSLACRLAQLFSRVKFEPRDRGDRDGFAKSFRNFLGDPDWPESLRSPSGSKLANERYVLGLLEQISEPSCTIFCTTTNQFGYTFEDIEEEDLIYWVPGCRRPHVFRADQHNLKIVGRCELWQCINVTENEHFEMLDAGTWENIVIG
ncbi:MAG: hypothetical protein M1820_007666 [Bogoriella megaspora]|nr:MAG: hypothetical protein M1820_007666 [Bogoriella megaspora]